MELQCDMDLPEDDAEDVREYIRVEIVQLLRKHEARPSSADKDSEMKQRVLAVRKDHVS